MKQQQSICWIKSIHALIMTRIFEEFSNDKVCQINATFVPESYVQPSTIMVIKTSKHLFKLICPSTKTISHDRYAAVAGNARCCRIMIFELVSSSRVLTSWNCLVKMNWISIFLAYSNNHRCLFFLIFCYYCYINYFEVSILSVHFRQWLTFFFFLFLAVLPEVFWCYFVKHINSDESG